MDLHSQPSPTSIAVVEHAGRPCLKVPPGTLGWDLSRAFRDVKAAGYEIPRKPGGEELLFHEFDEDDNGYIELRKTGL